MIIVTTEYELVFLALALHLKVKPLHLKDLILFYMIQNPTDDWRSVDLLCIFIVAVPILDLKNNARI